MEMKKEIQKIVRVDSDVKAELEFLAGLYQTSQNDVVNNLIRAEYNKYKEDPKLKKMLDTMNSVKLQFEEMQKQLDEAGFKK